MHYPQNLLLGATLVILSELMFATMGAMIKAASAGLPNEMIVFFRNLFGLAVVLPIVLRSGLGGIATQVPYLHLTRSLSGVGAMYCFFFSLSQLPLADAMLLKLTAPIFIPLIALVWLHEGFPVSVRWAVAIGFIGAGLILGPSGAVQWAALAGLAGGMLAALAKVTVRRLSATEPTSRIVFYFALIAALISAVPLAWSWQAPSGEEWLLLVALGPVATIGQLLLTRAYSLAPAGQIGPFTYVSIVFAGLLGWIFWNEVLSVRAVFGALCIFGAGLLILYSHRGLSAAVQSAG